jgi:hypothetical protein
MWSSASLSRFFLAALLCGGVVPKQAQGATPSGAVALPSSNLFNTTVRGKKITCGNLPPWSPGRMTRGLFYSTKAELAAIKAKARRATSSAARSALQTQARTLTSKLTAGRSACRSGKPAPTPAPTPPTSGNGFFDSAGRVTSAGKAAFGIPSSFSAAVGAGVSAWRQECAGCHGASIGAIRTNNYGQMRARVQLAPMSFSIPSELTEQQIADITAYANF